MQIVGLSNIVGYIARDFSLKNGVPPAREWRHVKNLVLQCNGLVGESLYYFVLGCCLLFAEQALSRTVSFIIVLTSQSFSFFREVYDV